jgi:hypothetical protein
MASTTGKPYSVSVRASMRGAWAGSESRALIFTNLDLRYNVACVTKIDTADGARTGFFVPERDSLFVAIPRHGSQSVEIRCYQVK